jgi:hypothetical protein
MSDPLLERIVRLIREILLDGKRVDPTDQQTDAALRARLVVEFAEIERIKQGWRA